MKVGKIFTFEAAHFLPGHPKCGQMHGHSYKVEVTVEGPVNEQGMVYDFGLLTQHMRPILDFFDHKCLNNLAWFGMNCPTAEQLCISIRKSLDTFPAHLKVGVKVWETATSWAEL